MPATLVAPTLVQAREANVLRSVKYVLENREVLYTGGTAISMPGQFANLEVTVDDEVWHREMMVYPTVYFGVQSVGRTPIGGQLTSVRNALTVTCWSIESPSTTRTELQAKKRSAKQLSSMCSFIDCLMRDQFWHIDLLDGDNNDTVVGSMVVQNWTGMSRVRGMLQGTGKGVLHLEVQDAT